MKNILITGATGFIGKELVIHLLEKGYSVGVLSRRDVNIEGVSSYLWDYEKKEIDLQALKFADIIIHLAGANVGDKRWTKKRKQEILDSRVQTSRLIRQELLKNDLSIEAFISASGIGFYGEGNDQDLTEDNLVVTPDFLSNVCVAWEEEAKKFKSICRVAYIRTGFVVGKYAAGFMKMVKPIAMGFGAPLGSGHQYTSWIHIQDLVRIYELVIREENLKGSINATSPFPITNKEMSMQIAKHLKRAFFMPSVPRFVLKVILGEMGNLVLVGNKVIPQKLIKGGFKFDFLNLKDALEEIFPRK